MDPNLVVSGKGAYAGLVKAKSSGLTQFIGFSGQNDLKDLSKLCNGLR